MALFIKQKPVILLTRNHLYYWDTTFAESDNPKHYSVVDSNFQATLSEIKAEHDFDTIKVLLANDVSYTFTMKVPLESSLKRDQIQEIAQSHVPETISETTFDWKLHHSDEKDHYIEAMVIGADLYQLLEQTEKNTNTTFTSIKTLPVILARASSEESQATKLVLWLHEEPQMLIHKNGAVIHSQNLVGYDAQEIQTLRSYFQREYDNLEISQAIIDLGSNQNEVLLNALSDLDATQKNIHPYKFFSEQKGESTKDEKNLDLVLSY